jgi:hypothetical protein
VVDTEEKVLNRKELSEFNGLNGKALKKAYNLYYKVALIIRSKVIRIENNLMIHDIPVMFQRNLLHPQKINTPLRKKLVNISYPEFDKIRLQIKKFTEFVQFPINNGIIPKDHLTMIIIVCYPNEALTLKLNPICLGFTFKYLRLIVKLKTDNVVTMGQGLMKLRKNLRHFLSKHPLISANLLALKTELKTELTSSLTLPKQINEEVFTKDDKTADITKTENPASEDKQNLNTITMYSQEISPNELAEKLSVPFSALFKAKEELGQMWSRGKLDYCKAKRICSKFGYEIIDKSPKDNF